MRLAISATVFLAIMLAVRRHRLALGAPGLPVAVLTGMALRDADLRASPPRRRTTAGFAMLFRFGIVPMFLFSGTFFPVVAAARRLQPIAYVTPLWHGVDLCRDLSLGEPDLSQRARSRRRTCVAVDGRRVRRRGAGASTSGCVT